MSLRLSRTPELLILTVVIAAGLAHLKRPLTVHHCATVVGRLATTVLGAARRVGLAAAPSQAADPIDPLVAATDYRGDASTGAAPAPAALPPAQSNPLPQPRADGHPPRGSLPLTRGQSPAVPSGSAVTVPLDLEPPAAFADAESVSNSPATATPVPVADPTHRELNSLADELRHAGARYYRLESWGTSGSLYRFQCWMSISGDSGPERYFEATDKAPLRAMQQVARQVRDWRRSE